MAPPPLALEGMRGGRVPLHAAALVRALVLTGAGMPLLLPCEGGTGRVAAAAVVVLVPPGYLRTAAIPFLQLLLLGMSFLETPAAAPVAVAVEALVLVVVVLAVAARGLIDADPGLADRAVVPGAEKIGLALLWLLLPPQGWWWLGGRPECDAGRIF